MAAQATSFEPKPGYSPSFAVISGQLHQWGIRQDGTVAADLFDFYSELWTITTTQGTIPPGLFLAASTGSEHYLYTYGGMTEDDSPTGCLHRLDTKTSTWSQLAAHSADSPMKKTGSGMIVYKNCVIIVGGWGKQHCPLQTGFEWIQSNSNRGEGLTNEMHKFDLSKGKVGIAAHTH